MNAHCERFNHTIQDEFVDYHETLLFDDLDAAVPGVTVDTSDFLAKVTIAVSDVPAWRGTDSKRLKTPLPAYAGGGFSSPKEKATEKSRWLLRFRAGDLPACSVVRLLVVVRAWAVE